jgi:hypothetical protein
MAVGMELFSESTKGSTQLTVGRARTQVDGAQPPKLAQRVLLGGS